MIDDEIRFLGAFFQRAQTAAFFWWTACLLFPAICLAELKDITSLGSPTQSTEWNGGLYPARFAVDGNPATFSHTDIASVGNRWKLAFENDQPIVEVRITARGDCCPGRLEGTTLRLFDAQGRSIHHEPVRDPGLGEDRQFVFAAGIEAASVQIGFEGFATNPEGNRALHLGEVAVFADVSVGPEILTFSVEPVSIDAGSPITLRWDVPGAQETLLRDAESVRSLPPSGELILYPNASSEFILEARDATGTSRAATAVLVDQVPLSPVLTEFMSSNADFLADPPNGYPDWVEIYNPNPIPLPLESYALTDDPAETRGWTFPPIVLGAHAYAVFFSANGSPAPLGPERFPFGLSAGEGSYLALTDSQGAILSEYAAYPQQRDNVSFGIESGGRRAFFPQPTPGLPNGSGIAGFQPRPVFSRAGGFVDAAFELTIDSGSESGDILYTLDASWPAEENPAAFVYGGAIPIDVTTVVRARCVAPGEAPSEVVSHTYIFLDQVLRQPVLPDGYTSNWGDGPGITAPMPAKSDYAMDPRVVDASPWIDANGESFSMEDALLAIPSVVIGIDKKELFDPRTGIHANALFKSRAWERRISFEYFDPSSAESFALDAGLRMQGGWNRHPESLKKSFRLYFRSDYGSSKLDYPLFADSSVRSFDTLVLRAGNGKAWSSPWRPLTGSTNNSLERTQYLRDQFVRDSQRDTGQPSSHGSFVHVYINGLYWGLYNLIERVDEHFAASWFGGEREDYDVLKWIRAEGGVQANEGSVVRWNQALSMARSQPDSLATWESLQEFIDFTNLVDYMLVNIYVGNTDWPDSNAYTLGAPAHGQPFRFFCWDAEETLVTVDVDQTGVGTPNTIAEFYSRLRNNPEFRVLLGDRIEKHFRDTGALTPEASDRRWMALACVIDRAIVGESARWGDLMRPSRPYTRDDWLNEQRNLRQNYFGASGDGGRTTRTLAQFQAASLTPRLRSPVASAAPGLVAPGTAVTVQRRSIFMPGQVYYTLDGSDPRLPGGGLHQAAESGDVPFVVDGEANLRARVFHAPDWGALLEARFYSGRPPAAGDLIVSEIMYHPASDGDAEYLELLNTTSDHLLLDGVYFDAGIQFVFPIGTVLAPGDRLLLVADRDAFTAAYGEHLQIAGEFAENTRLSNSGELLKLVASDGLTELDSVDYSDAGVWPSAADGSGYSLTRRDPPQQGHSSWRLSVLPDGSPGTSDSTIFDGDPLADADNNSVPDLIDYALGPAPHLNSSIDRSGELPLQRLSFRRNLAADDVHLALEVSADAEQWSPAGDEWLFFPGDPLGDGTALDRFERSSPGPEPTILVRLKAAFRP